ncbi:MAG: DNA-binding domain-containing protein [Nevskiaceae bacterium]|jgi:hypothetical protein|nr:DNA-binding domain-containing protein [Nevskiaceae bacterium]
MQHEAMTRHEDLSAFAAALRDPQAAVPEGLLAPEGVPVADRFAVYRNNVYVSLIDALAERHPVVQALVGEDFFRAMARAYVRQQRPREASLLQFGDTFPAFIEAFAPAGEVPYLADVAALENLWQQSWGAADAPALSLQALAGLSPEQMLTMRFCAHPATRLLRSRWPVGGIWQCHQQPEPHLGDLNWEGQNVLLTRPDADIHLLMIPNGVAALAASLMSGARLESAVVEAFAEEADLDVGGALRMLIEAGFASEVAAQ